MATYSTYSRELHAAATRRDVARRASPTAGDYYRALARDGHTDINLDRCPSGGGEAARWATDAEIPEWLNFGDHVCDFDLKHISERCGVNVAASVDALCGPCGVCELSTYGGGVCSQCEDGRGICTFCECDLDGDADGLCDNCGADFEEKGRIHASLARSNRGPVVTAELAGSFTPRCDF